MIRRLRRKFILISMVSVFVVLFLIMGAINLANFRSVVAGADARVDLVLHGDEKFPGFGEGLPRDGDDAPEDGGNEDFRRGGRKFFFGPGALNEEARFDTRFFTVTFDESGEATLVNTGRIAAVDAETAVSLAAEKYAAGKTAGFSGNYRYRAVSAGDGCTLYVFLDVSRELATFKDFLTASVVISLLGFILVLLPVLFFSRMALKPVEESVNKQKRFITDASHEIKTPLAVISAANEVIEIENGESEWTESISKQVARLSSLTEKLVRLTRMDEESFRLNPVELDLSAAVEETALSFEAVAKARNRGLTVDVAPGVRYTGDEAALKQLVSLLVDNAMKYSNDGGQVKVSLEKRGRGPVLKVENSTDGIEKGDLGILFERFYRRDRSRSSATGGHGIGLSVAEAIVKAHKGKITAVSPDGVNVVFTAQL